MNTGSRLSKVRITGFIDHQDTAFQTGTCKTISSDGIYKMYSCGLATTLRSI